MKTIKYQWVGETGWQLFTAQGYMRKLSETNNIEVTCFEEDTFYYEDFASKITTIKRPDTYQPDCWKDVGGFDYGNKDFDFPPNTKILDGFDPNVMKQQKLIKFGNPIYDDIDIVFHCRTTEKTNSGHYNWGEDNWDMLMYKLDKHGYNVTCIGLKTMSYCPGLAKDLRNKNLKYVTDLLASSKLIVGGSSGPMHLASLCGTEQIIWSGLQRSEIRYKKNWNFFNSHVSYLPTWEPSVEEVFEKIKERLDENIRI